MAELSEFKISWISVLTESVKRLNPLYLLKTSPIMFIVELGAFFELPLVFYPSPYLGTWFYVDVFAILLITVWFSTLSESFSEHEAKARVDFLKGLEKEIVAHKLVGDKVVDVKSSELRIGDYVVVEQNEYVPQDGFVVEGEAFVDESMLTGESEPAFKGKGDRVISGTKVVTGKIVVEVAAEPGRSYLDKMIALISGAKRAKMRSEIMLSMLLLGLSLIFLVVVASLYFVLGAFGNYPDPSLMISLLVALMPTTIGGLLPAIGISGVLRLASHNVIAKSGKAVEAAGDVDVVIFDKTGTITEGIRSAVEFVPLNNYSERDVAIAAYLSSVGDSTHEAKSIIGLAEEKGYVPAKVLVEEAMVASRINYTPSKRYGGIVFAWRGGKRMFGEPEGQPLSRIEKEILAMRSLGEEVRIVKGAPDAILRLLNIDKDPRIEDIVRTIGSRGDTPLLVAFNDVLVGFVVLRDRLKKGIRERIHELKLMGIKTVMITGDNPYTAASIAKEAGIEDFYAQAKPEDKLLLVEREEKQGHVVAVMGDGTNDAPALARADVGVAMHTGTRPAKEAANMIDLDSNPARIVDIIKLGRSILTTRGALTTFSIMNDIAKYFTILPFIISTVVPQASFLNFLNLYNTVTAVLATMIFNAIIIPLLIPLAVKGAGFKVSTFKRLLVRNLIVYGITGAIIPFVAIKLIDTAVAWTVYGVIHW
ncbi:HAD-IC family P-type ATPase [Thermogladius sp. KZ2Tp1]|uniref:HAD-IC family P-type ATPase n=1 Tax=Thermogladius sp. KZ2Tp1 TaxID=3136289 RepID=UPI003DA884FB